MRQLFRTGIARWTTFLGGIGGALALAALLSSGVSGASSVTPGTVSPTSNVAGANTSYLITFTTSSVTGGIPAALQTCPAQCSITLTAPNNTVFSSAAVGYHVNPTSGTATVGSVAVSKVVGPGAMSTSGTNNQVVITLSSSTIGASDTVSVKVDTVSNPTEVSSNDVIDVSTSSDTTPSATSAYSIVAGPFAKLAVASGNNQSANTGSTFAQPLQVVLEDAHGNQVAPQSSVPVTFTAPASQASATFTTGTNADTTPANSSGVATSSPLTANAIPGKNYQVTATATSPTGPTETSFSLTNVGAPARLVLSGAVSGAASSSATLGPITVQEQDAAGNLTTSAETVNLSSSSGPIKSVFSATSGGATTTSINISSGSSSATFYYGDKQAGSPQITASASGLTSAMQSETISAAGVQQLTITSSAVSGAATSSATLGASPCASPPCPITVQEQDAFGNPTTTAETVNLSSNSAGTAVFSATSDGSPTTSVNITSGSSNASFFYGDTKAGSPKITAAASGLTSAMQTEAISAANPAKIAVVSGNNQSTPAGQAFGLPLIAQVEDAFGNAVAGSGVQISFTAPNTGASATFNNTTNEETDATGAN